MLISATKPLKRIAKNMPIIACGINHKTAPIALREQAAFLKENIPLYLQDLQANENIREAVLLSTCNRSEIYCDGDEAALFDWFCRQHALSPSRLREAWYCYHHEEALAHIMQVACGLDSMVLGEPQILGQMKEAFSESCANAMIGAQFNRLFQEVFAVAKEVRTHTAIGACPVSLASASVNLLKQVYPANLDAANITLVGAGDTIQLILRYLKTQGIHRLTVVNRREENAAVLAEKFSIKGSDFSKLKSILRETDILITATGSAVPIITHEHLYLREAGLPLVMLDLAVPRDIDPEVSECPYVALYSLDDLRNIIEQNQQGREHAAQKAKQIIQQKSEELMQWLTSFDQVAATIRVYRKQIEDICEVELQKALRQLKNGENAANVLHEFARAFTNKLLHHPSIQLRQAGAEGRLEFLQLAQQLFLMSEAKAV